MKRMIMFFTICFYVSLTSVSAWNSVFYAKRLPNGSYYTRGIVPVALPAAETAAVFADFGHYSRWALKGLDGKDPVSRKHIGIFKRIVYDREKQKVILIYDINLIWPFGSKDNEFPLDIGSLRYEKDRLKSFTLSFTESGPTIKSMHVKISIIGGKDSSALDISCTIDFTWLIDPIMNVKKYKNSISGRIMILVKNIETVCGK